VRAELEVGPGGGRGIERPFVICPSAFGIPKGATIVIWGWSAGRSVRDTTIVRMPGVVHVPKASTEGFPAFSGSARDEGGESIRPSYALLRDVDTVRGYHFQESPKMAEKCMGLASFRLGMAPFGHKWTRFAEKWQKPYRVPQALGIVGNEWRQGRIKLHCDSYISVSYNMDNPRKGRKVRRFEQSSSREAFQCRQLCGQLRPLKGRGNDAIFRDSPVRKDLRP